MSGSQFPVPGVNSDVLEDDPDMSEDGLHVYFFSARLGGGGADIWFAHRNSAEEPSSEPQPLEEIDTAGMENDPWLPAGGSYIVYTSGADLYEAYR